MLNKIQSFLLNEDKVDQVIWFVGYVVIGWILDILSWIAAKTKTTKDDELVKEAKEKVKKAKEKKKK